jgi:hypothetical protein
MAFHIHRAARTDVLADGLVFATAIAQTFPEAGHIA